MTRSACRSGEPVRTIHFVALGCPKNRVDTERLAGLAQATGMELVGDPAAAEVIVVNTCGFVLSAKEESIDTVLELAHHKRGRCRALVMVGCLVQRYPEELAQELPEVDHFLGTADLPRLAEILDAAPTPRLVVGPPRDWGEERYARALVGPPHLAYLKIAEGCDRLCAFCIIPALRGRQRSRTLPSLVAEAEALVAGGARELVLVAQDTTSYGKDLAPRRALVDLLAALERLEPLRWIRLLYAYPSAVDRPLLEAMARLPRVVPYLDLPLQHVDDAVLRRMHRGYDGDGVRRLIDEARRLVTGLHLRATLIAGHPGETAASHRTLRRFLKEAELDHVGVFPFSAEEGTDAATQPDQVPTELAEERAAELMEHQRQVSRKKLRRLRGQRLEVQVDGPSVESEHLLQGRHAGQAPEVDGVVFLADGDAPPGGLVQALVTDSADYDLVARVAAER